MAEKLPPLGSSDNLRAIDGHAACDPEKVLGSGPEMNSADFPSAALRPVNEDQEAEVENADDVVNKNEVDLSMSKTEEDEIPEVRSEAPAQKTENNCVDAGNVVNATETSRDNVGINAKIIEIYNILKSNIGLLTSQGVPAHACDDAINELIADPGVMARVWEVPPLENAPFYAISAARLYLRKEFPKHGKIGLSHAGDSMELRPEMLRNAQASYKEENRPGNELFLPAVQTFLESNFSQRDGHIFKLRLHQVFGEGSRQLTDEEIGDFVKCSVTTVTTVICRVHAALREAIRSEPSTFGYDKNDLPKAVDSPI